MSNLSVPEPVIELPSEIINLYEKGFDIDKGAILLKDGEILSSTACLFVAKKKAAKLQPFLNSFG